MFNTTQLKQASLIALLLLLGFALNSLQAQFTSLTNPLTNGPVSEGIIDFSEANISADGNTLITAGYNRGNTAEVFGWVQTYERSGEDWLPQGPRFEDPNAPSPNALGRAIAISDDGNTIAFSDPLNKYIKAFTWNGTAWTQKGTTIEWNSINNFGHTLSMSADGNQLVTSEKDYASFPLRVFRFTDGDWEFSREYADIEFMTTSMSTAISGDGSTMAVGHGHRDNGVDGTQIFHWVNGSLEPKGQILHGVGPEDTFGARVALSTDGNTVAINTQNTYNEVWDCTTGYFRVYTFQDGSWIQQGATIFDDTEVDCWNSGFGYGMALSGAGDIFTIGNTLVPVNGVSETGRVLVFRLVDGNWEEEVELHGNQEGEHFGYPLSLSRDGSVLTVGSWDYPNDERRMEFFNVDFSPVNDDPCNAIALPVNGEPQTGFSNEDADIDQPEVFLLPDDPSNYDILDRTVWFTFVAPPSGAITATTCGLANFDTEIAIFETSNCEDYSVYNLLGYNDDAFEECSGSTESFLRVGSLSPGQTYYLVVDGYIYDVGDFGLTLSEVLPACDNPAIAFDGVDDYLDFGPNQGNLGAGDFTIELMINTDQQPSTPGNHVPIAEKRNGCGGNLFWYLHIIADGRIKMELVECCGRDNFIFSDGPVNDGQWHHLAVVRAGNTFSLYVDGQLNGEMQDENVSFDVVSNQDLRLGYSDCIPAGIADYFDGEMDEFRLWEVARSPEELSAFQQKELVGDEPGLLAYYNFNDGAPFADNGGRIGTIDLTGSSSVGRLVNFSRQGNASNWVTGTAGVTQLDRDADGLYDACNAPVDLPTSTLTLVYSGAQLGQNFPNPTAAETLIPLQLSGQAARARLQITDALGRVVQTIPVTAATGTQLSLNTTEFPAGLYFYSLFVGEHLVDTKRMVVNR